MARLDGGSSKRGVQWRDKQGASAACLSEEGVRPDWAAREDKYRHAGRSRELAEPHCVRSFDGRSCRQGNHRSSIHGIHKQRCFPILEARTLSWPIEYFFFLLAPRSARMSSWVLSWIVLARCCRKRDLHTFPYCSPCIQYSPASKEKDTKGDYLFFAKTSN
jgi:hypothetical protein